MGRWTHPVNGEPYLYVRLSDPANSAADDDVAVVVPAFVLARFRALGGAFALASVVHWVRLFRIVVLVEHGCDDVLHRARQRN